MDPGGSYQTRRHKAQKLIPDSITGHPNSVFAKRYQLQHQYGFARGARLYEPWTLIRHIAYKTDQAWHVLITQDTAYLSDQ